MRAVLLICATAWMAVEAQDFQAMQNLPKYDTRFDYLDVDDILSSRRLVRNYVNCLLYSQRCTPEGKELKKVMPDALRTKCVRCTEKQKRGAVKVIRRLKEEFPEEWNQLQARWDPTGDFTRYFEQQLAKEAFNYIPDSGSPAPGSYLPPGPANPVVLNIPQTTRPPPPLTPPATTRPPMSADTTTPKVMVVNRFGGDGELMMGSPSAAAGTLRPSVIMTNRPVVPSMPASIPTMPTRPLQTTGSAVGAASDALPARLPTRQPADDMPIYTAAASVIDLICENIKQLVKKTVEVVSG